MSDLKGTVRKLENQIAKGHKNINENNRNSWDMRDIMDKAGRTKGIEMRANPVDQGRQRLDTNPEWTKATDPSSGDTYYYHKQTHEARWDKPMILRKDVIDD